MGQKASYALRDPNRHGDVLAGGGAVLDADAPSGVARNCTSDVAYNISPATTTSESRGGVVCLASPQSVQTERSEFFEDPFTVEELRRRPEMEERLGTNLGGNGDGANMEVNLSGCTDEQIAELLAAQQKFSTASFEWQFPSALSMKRLVEEEPEGSTTMNGDEIVLLANAVGHATKTRNGDDYGSAIDDDNQSEKTMGDEGGSDSTSNGDDSRTTTIQPTVESIEVTMTATVVNPLKTSRGDTNGERKDCAVSSIVVEEDDVTTVEEKEFSFQELESAPVEVDDQSSLASELSGRGGSGGTSLPSALDDLKENELTRTADICEQLTKHATLTDANSAQQQMDQH